MRLGVRRIERAAEDMRQLVVQRHRDIAERGRAAPRRIERLRAGRAVLRVLDEPRKAIAERRHRILAHQFDHRIAVGGVKSLHRMRNGVHRRGDGEADRQTHREIDVVDHRLRTDVRRASRCLFACRRLAKNVGHFRAGVGGGDDNLIGTGADGDGFAQPGGRAAAEADDRRGAAGAEGLERPVRDLDRSVHDRAGEDPHGEAA